MGRDEEMDDDSDLDSEDFAEQETAVDENPFDVEAHTQLISAYKRNGELDRLRGARAAASKFVALPEEEWLAWISDETAVFSDTPEGRKQYQELHQQAVTLCPRASLWIKRAEAAKKLGEDVKAQRAIFESGLSVFGLIPTDEAAGLWKAYREFEGSDGDKVRALFHRQLSVPSPKLEDLIGEYTSWEKDQSQIVEAKRRMAEAEKIQQKVEKTITRNPYEGDTIL